MELQLPVGQKTNSTRKKEYVFVGLNHIQKTRTDPSKRKFQMVSSCKPRLLLSLSFCKMLGMFHNHRQIFENMSASKDLALQKIFFSYLREKKKSNSFFLNSRRKRKTQSDSLFLNSGEKKQSKSASVLTQRKKLQICFKGFLF